MKRHDLSYLPKLEDCIQKDLWLLGVFYMMMSGKYNSGNDQGSGRAMAVVCE